MTTRNTGNRHVLTPQTALATPQAPFFPLLPLFNRASPSTANRTGFVQNNVALPSAGFYGHRLTKLVGATDLGAASVEVGLVVPDRPIRPTNQIEMSFYVGHGSEADNTTATGFVWLEEYFQQGDKIEYRYQPAFGFTITGGAVDVAVGSDLFPSAGSSALASVNWCDTIVVSPDCTYGGSVKIVPPSTSAVSDVIASVVFDALGASGLAVAFRIGTAAGAGGAFREI